MMWQDYSVICKVIETKLSKDLSTFFSSMSVYCEVKFSTIPLELGKQYAAKGEVAQKKNTGVDTG